MDLKWLKDFLTVADLGNFTRAAETLNSSQTALSRRIQALEGWLGVTLIDRSIFPTRLTAEGERFRQHAADILSQMLDAKSEVSGKLMRDHVRIALPYALATSSLPGWWEEWSRDRNLSCSVVLGNVHDMMTELAAGTVDLLICFQSAHQPIHLDALHYDRIILRSERLRPYASRAFLQRHPSLLPGKPDRPIPLLTYSPGVYFRRLVELILETAPHKLHTRRVMECDMSDVLRDMAMAGHGVAWLLEGSASMPAAQDLVAVDDGSLSLPIATTAYRSRKNDRPALERLWERLPALEQEV